MDTASTGKGEVGEDKRGAFCEAVKFDNVADKMFARVVNFVEKLLVTPYDV